MANTAIPMITLPQVQTIVYIIVCTKTGVTLLQSPSIQSTQNGKDSSTVRTLFRIDRKDHRFLSEPL